MKTILKSRITQMMCFWAVVGCCYSCGYQRHDNWQGGKIVRTGEYNFAKGGYKIVVTNEDHLIRYRLLNSNGDTVIRSNDNISSFQTWALYLDSVGNLWALSSDIGDAVWRQSVDGKYKKEFITDSSLRNTIPAEIRRR